MIAKMLVTIDNTESAQHALVQASVLARSENSQLTLLSVVPAYEGDLRIMGKSKVLEEMREPYRQALVKAETVAKSFGLITKTVLEEGEPYAIIGRLAKEEQVDLVVLNKTAHYSLDLFPVGSVTTRVISHSQADVLVIPKQANLGLDKILAAYDNSQASKKAAKKAIELALVYGSELTIITAFEVPLEGFVFSPGIWDKIQAEAKRLQDSVVQLAKDKGVRKVEGVLKHGKPSEEICTLAQEIKAGMIIMGSKRKSALKKWFLGNVVQHVISNDVNPVWIIKK